MRLTSIRPAVIGLVGALALGLVGAPVPARAATATVDVSPIGYISGAQTRLVGSADLVVLPSGERVVVDAQIDEVQVFASDASGNVAPSRVIAGAATGLDSPRSVTAGPDGTLYVGQISAAGSSVLVFAPGATGNVAPTSVLSGANTGLSWPTGLALDSTGRLYVANRSADSVTVYAPGVSGNSLPLRQISGANTGLADPESVLIKEDGSLLVGNGAGGAGTITHYASGATGNATPIGTIGGTTAGLVYPWSLALDSAGDLYVADSDGFAGPHRITVFAPDADGDVAPLLRLTGGNTDLDSPSGVAVLPDRRVVVSCNGGSGRLLTFAPLIPLLPGKVRKLEVAGSETARKRTISWAAPSTGGEPTRYLLTVSRGSKAVVQARTTKTRLTLDTAKLKAGTYALAVRAQNATGKGPVARTTFTVR